MILGQAAVPIWLKAKRPYISVKTLWAMSKILCLKNSLSMQGIRDGLLMLSECMRSQNPAMPYA